MRKLVLLIVSIGLLTSNSGCVTGLLVMRAARNARKGNYEQADKLYEKSLAKSEERSARARKVIVLDKMKNANYETYIKRAIVLEKIGEDEKALEALSKAIELSPRNDGLAYFYRAEWYHRHGDMNRGLSDVEKAIACNCKDVQAVNLRGQIHLAQGNFQASLEDFNTALGLAKKEKAYNQILFNRAVANFKLGGFKEAARHASTYVARNSQHKNELSEEDYYTLSLIFYSAGDYARAEEFLSKLPRAKRKEIKSAFGEVKVYSQIHQD